MNCNTLQHTGTHWNALVRHEPQHGEGEREKKGRGMGLMSVGTEEGRT